MAVRGVSATGEGGLKVLVALRQANSVRPGPCGLDEEAWRKWASSPFLELWQLVALHSSVDPDSLGNSPEFAIRALRYSKFRDAVQLLLKLPPDDRPIVRLQRNFERALLALHDGDLKPMILGAQASARALISLDEFRSWVTRAGIGIAGTWVPRHHYGEFPYWTNALDVARKVAIDFAARYMDDDASRAPSSPETIRHAVNRYMVSQNTAKAIARVLRPDHLPRGRRRKPRKASAQG
jgi:hypothetical protein